jgi:hypothetical protein
MSLSPQIAINKFSTRRETGSLYLTSGLVKILALTWCLCSLSGMTTVPSRQHSPSVGRPIGWLLAGSQPDGTDNCGPSSESYYCPCQDPFPGPGARSRGCTPFPTAARETRAALSLSCYPGRFRTPLPPTFTISARLTGIKYPKLPESRSGASAHV